MFSATNLFSFTRLYPSFSLGETLFFVETIQANKHRSFLLSQTGSGKVFFFFFCIGLEVFCRETLERSWKVVWGWAHSAFRCCRRGVVHLFEGCVLGAGRGRRFGIPSHLRTLVACFFCLLPFHATLVCFFLPSSPPPAGTLAFRRFKQNHRTDSFVYPRLADGNRGRRKYFPSRNNSNLGGNN